MTGYSLPNGPAAYTAGDLNSKTAAELRALAASLGYSVTGNRKSDIVSQILKPQEVQDA